MFITVNEKGERIIYDGEALEYECKMCSYKFERLIDYGCCCPNRWMRKRILEENPTVCPNCNSHNVERIRTKEYPSLFELTIGRKLYEWED